MNKETVITAVAYAAAVPIIILALALSIASSVAPIVIALWVYHEIFG